VSHSSSSWTSPPWDAADFDANQFQNAAIESSIDAFSGLEQYPSAITDYDLGLESFDVAHSKDQWFTAL
jgi:hypothetical protein